MAAHDEKISQNRRRLFKALSTAPVIMTLRPGEAFATASAVQCLDKDTDLLAYPNKDLECADGDCFATIPAPRYSVIIDRQAGPACTSNPLNGNFLVKSPDGKYIRVGGPGINDFSEYVEEELGSDRIRIIQNPSEVPLVYCTDYFGPDTEPGYLTVKAPIIQTNGVDTGWDIINARAAVDLPPITDARGLTATCVVSVLPGEEDAFTFLRG